VRTASLNRHDLLALAGGLRPTDLPRILGSDAAGIDHGGNEVVIHAALNAPSWDGPEELDPHLSLLSEECDGTFAAIVCVPTRNLVTKPPEMTFEEAACLPTAWLTAYRMLFTQTGAAPGSTVLVQGAGGGVATALTMLGAAAGLRMWVTSRSAAKREQAIGLGAQEAFEPGARLPERADFVMDTVGETTWQHSLKAVKPGGTVVVAGVTSGANPPANLSRIMLSKLRIVGSTIGTRDELIRLVRFCSDNEIHPPIHATMPLANGISGLRELAGGQIFGKIVLTV
jgi:NADPH:quinone reductase-like Zn-dependent oxidoreductase